MNSTNFQTEGVMELDNETLGMILNLRDTANEYSKGGRLSEMGRDHAEWLEIRARRAETEAAWAEKQAQIGLERPLKRRRGKKVA